MPPEIISNSHHEIPLKIATKAHVHSCSACSIEVLVSYHHKCCQFSLTIEATPPPLGLVELQVN